MRGFTEERCHYRVFGLSTIACRSNEERWDTDQGFHIPIAQMNNSVTTIVPDHLFSMCWTAPMNSRGIDSPRVFFFFPFNSVDAVNRFEGSVLIADIVQPADDRH